MSIKKILLSQPEPATGKSPYHDIAEKHNVQIDFRPFIKVEPLSAKDFRTQRINILDYTAVIFNARHGVDHFFRMAQELRITIPDSMKYFCVSETVAYYLQKYITYRKRKVFFTNSGKFVDMPSIFTKSMDEKFLYVTSDVRNEETMQILEESGINFKQAIMYQTVSNNISEKELDSYDMLVFFSPAGIKSLLENVPNFKQNGTKIGSFGTNTAFAVREANLRLDLEAPFPGVVSMAAAIDWYIKEQNNPKK